MQRRSGHDHVPDPVVGPYKDSGVIRDVESTVYGFLQKRISLCGDCASFFCIMKNLLRATNDPVSVQVSKASQLVDLVLREFDARRFRVQAFFEPAQKMRRREAGIHLCREVFRFLGILFNIVDFQC